MALSSILPPGYRAFKAVQQQNEQSDLAGLQQAQMAMGLQEKLRQRNEEVALKAALAESNGDPEKAVEIAIRRGDANTASKLAPLAKMASERRQAQETRAGVRSLLTPQQAPAQNPMVPGPGASVMAGSGSATPSPQPQPSATERRLAHLNALEAQYATNPTVLKMIETEKGRLSAASERAPQRRERVEGENLVQEEFVGGKWGEIGRGPRFARQVAPTSTETGGVPGGTGSTMMQDPNTGQRYMVDTKRGKAWEFDDEGLMKATNINNLPRNLVKVGGIGTAGARESIFTQRMIQAGNQASKDLENVVKLPLTATRGPFGAFGAISAPSFLDAGKVVLGNVMTTQEQQTYNAMATGFQRTLAAIEAAGLMPSGSLTHQMDAVLYKPGDTNLTKLHKLAQTRQIVEAGMEVILANPRISDSEKSKVREVVERLQKAVPFTHGDLVKLDEKQKTNDKATLRQVLNPEEKPAAAKPAAAPAQGGPYSDAEKERRYQEWKKSQGR